MRLACYIALALGILLRLVMLGRWPGINGDEAWYGVNVQELLSGGTPFLHTGVGNPLNLLHSGLLLALSVFFKPSAALLRAPEVIFGIAAVVLAYPMLSKPLGQRAAAAVAIVLAVSPTAVAYSRFGWDPSGTPLITLLAMAWAFADRPVLAGIASAVALWIHPTNIFVLPIVAAAWAPHALDRYRAASTTTRSRLLTLAAVAAIIAIPLAAWMAVRIAHNPNTTLPSVGMVIERIISPGEWLHRFWGFVNLLSGVSTAVHIAAPMRSNVATAINIATALLAAAGLVVGWRTFRSNRQGLALLGGIAIAFIGFHIVAMDLALEPTLERYGLFMLVPMVVVIAMASGTASILLSLLLAAVTIGGYFYPLATRGGDAMATYRTGAEDPKLAAYQFVDRDRAGRPALVIADDWFIYWTLRYFAGPAGPVHVEPIPGAELPGGTHPAGVSERPYPAPDRTYLVVFAGSRYMEEERPAQAAFTAVDPIGRPIVQVYAMPPLP